MAAQTSVRDYCALLTKSKLLAAEELELALKKWKEESPRQDDQVDSFCKFLISRRSLTEWQAAMVRRGRADGFFIGGYRIVDRIGKGQMGGVYKAVHGLGQLVALKILPASKAKAPHVLSRFQREARLLTQLDHPNVVRAFQVGESGGINFIAMEFLEGETLDETLTRRKRLPWAEAVRLMHQALCGLEHLFDRRMIHRDLKPANMMLTPAPGRHETTWESTVKILDIGLGRELFDESTPEGQIETQLTVEGSVLGTPDYLAPEQAKDARSADIRADIYSIGCVLFHCLCGHPPFPDTNIMSQMLKHATEKPPMLSSIVADIPGGIQSVLDTMLAKFPNERYSTPAAAANALQPFLGKGGVAPAVATMVPAFKEWLDTETHIDLAKIVPQAPAAPAKPTPAVQMPGPVKSGTVPSPALSMTPPPQKEPAASRTAAVKALPANPVRPIPVVPARPPVPQRPIPLDEVDVELVTDFVPGHQAPAIAPQVQIVKVKEVRPLWEFDRRDWIMLAAGAAGVLAAVGIGYGLARLARKKPDETTGEE
ncbi:MAG TPA: serine/threonine-protein kinase [Gemmata sp.]|jgi:serine/threonine protein kinase|nr:serine/threonine-protein kinase [Gemmata sp.]